MLSGAPKRTSKRVSDTNAVADVSIDRIVFVRVVQRFVLQYTFADRQSNVDIVICRSVTNCCCCSGVRLGIELWCGSSSVGWYRSYARGTPLEVDARTPLEVDAG